MPSDQTVSAWISKREPGWCLIVTRGAEDGAIVPLGKQYYWPTKEGLLSELKSRGLTVQDGNYVRLNKRGK